MRDMVIDMFLCRSCSLSLHSHKTWVHEQSSAGALQVGTATVKLPGAMFKNSFFILLKWQTLFSFINSKYFDDRIRFMMG